MNITILAEATRRERDRVQSGIFKKLKGNMNEKKQNNMAKAGRGGRDSVLGGSGA
jgi:hypothetical protein